MIMSGVLKMNSKNLLKRYFLVPFILIILYFIIYYSSIFSEILFPSPINITYEFAKIFTSWNNITNIVLTFMRIIAAFVISVLLGVFFGLIIGNNKELYNTLEPIIELIRSTPIIAIYPLIMLFFGIDTFSKIVFAFIGAFMIVLINCIYGVHYVNASYNNMSMLYKIKNKYFIFKILLPGILPFAFAGMRSAASTVIILIFVAEMFVGSISGIGHMITLAQYNYNIAKLYALILFSGIFGYIISKSLISLEKKIIFWR